MNKFEKDLERGQLYELKLLEHIKFVDFERPLGNFKEYDILIKKKNNKTITYEVKADRLIYNTDNICIEYECFNKPSGISTSTAKYWAIFEVKNDKKYRLYRIPTKKIREYIKNNYYLRDVKGGDFGASRMYLFDKHFFDEYIIYDNITEK